MATGCARGKTPHSRQHIRDRKAIGHFLFLWGAFVIGAKAEQLISSLQKKENVGRVLFSGRPEKRLQLILRTQKNGLFLAFPFSGRGSVTRKPGVFSGAAAAAEEKGMLPAQQPAACQTVLPEGLAAQV